MSKYSTEIYNLLKKEFKSPKTELNFLNNFQLLVAVILSAKCTDKTVNKVTKTLFKKYPDANSLAKAKQEDIEKLIFSCGFYKNKAKNLIAMSKSLIENYNGQVPSTHEELETLSGVGRKTANVMISVAFKGDAIAVDTHVYRVSKRLGISNGKTPFDVEKDLMKKFDKDKWSELHYLLVLHGRYICKSQKLNCVDCLLKDYCKFFKNNL